MHYRNKPVNPAMWVSGNRLPNFISLQERTTHQLETLYSFSCAHKTQSPSPSSRFDLISWRPCLSLCCWACPRLPRALSGSCQWDLGLFHQHPPGLAGGDSRNKGRFISQDTHRVSLSVLIDDPEICELWVTFAAWIPYTRWFISCYLF